jgi:hypothetical protein
VYIQQSLRAMRVLGWNRGAEWDSNIDWQVGMAYVFAPQTVGRGDLDLTQGQRFAKWWAGYCPVNCDNPVTEELRAELAADFDVAMVRP